MSYNYYINNIYEIIMKNSEYSLKRDFWKWLLVLFIVSLLTVSCIEGLSKIVILYGLIVSGVFSIYFLYHRLSFQPEVIIYFVWIIWSLSGMIIVIDKEVYFTQLMTLIQFCALIFTVAGITSLRRDMSAVMLATWIGCFVVLITSGLTGELQQATQMGTRTRAAGIVGNSNEFSLNMVFAIISVFYFWKTKTSIWWHIFLMINLAALSYGIVASASRTGIFGCLVFISLWWFYCKAKKLPKHPFTAYIILLMLISGTYYSTNYVLSDTLLGKRIENRQGFGETQTREKLYKEGISTVIKNPIFGVGLANFAVLSGGLYSHSNYIEVTANTGIVGFMLHFSMYVVLWRRLNRIKKISNEPNISYTVGILRAAILTILFVSFSSVLIANKLAMIFLGSAIGYTWSIESILTKMKSYRENRMGIYE